MRFGMNFPFWTGLVAVLISAVAFLLTLAVMPLDLSEALFVGGPYVVIGIGSYLARRNPFISEIAFCTAIVVTSIAVVILSLYWFGAQERFVFDGDSEAKGMALGSGAYLQWGVVLAIAVPGLLLQVIQRAKKG